eukprot:15466752-Heterocapsa_arctica.AAC.1
MARPLVFSSLLPACAPLRLIVLSRPASLAWELGPGQEEVRISKPPVPRPCPSRRELLAGAGPAADEQDSWAL